MPEASHPPHHDETWVRKETYLMDREFRQQQHGTVLLRIDALEARQVQNKEMLDRDLHAINRAIVESKEKMNERFNEFSLKWTGMMLVGLLVVAVNLPGLLSFLKAGH